jgi:hypothetical protein
MTRIDIDAAIRQHNHWRRQFINAFAGGAYADMPLSEHRGCTLAAALRKAECAAAGAADFQPLLAIDEHFHRLANEIVELSNSGLGHSADLLLPELNEASHQLVVQLDKLRAYQNR